MLAAGGIQHEIACREFYPMLSEGVINDQFAAVVALWIA
ncbi:Uncharacterised protein [Shigella sonnei]|nr:Uncharacterised protein [Shigella sonnei]